MLGSHLCVGQLPRAWRPRPPLCWAALPPACGPGSAVVCGRWSGWRAVGLGHGCCYYSCSGCRPARRSQVGSGQGQACRCDLGCAWFPRRSLLPPGARGMLCGCSASWAAGVGGGEQRCLGLCCLYPWTHLPELGVVGRERDVPCVLHPSERETPTCYDRTTDEGGLCLRFCIGSLSKGLSLIR